MDKPGTASKSKFTFDICPKFKNKTKRQKQQQQGQPQGQIMQPPTKNQQQKYSNNKSTKFNFTTNFYRWLPSRRVQSFYSLFHHNSCLLFYEIFKSKLLILSSILIHLMGMVKASHSTSKFQDDLVVCIPENSTKSCIEYVNSSSNGLIVLNESVYPGLKSFHGSYDYQMIARIDPFWLSFEPPSDTSYYVMGTLYTIIFVFGCTGNGLVIYMIARCKALRTSSSILVFNLAISDFMMIAKCPIAIYNNFMRGPALGDWGCRLHAFLGGFSGCASIGLLTVISVDRYTVVVNPLSPLRLCKTQKYYYFLLFLAWFEAIFFSVIPLLEVGLSSYVPEGYLTTCSFNYLDKTLPARIFMFLFFVFAFCLPLSSICYCYYHILKAVFISKDIQSNRNKHKMEIRLTFIVLLVIGLWFLAWTPYSIVAMLGVFGMEQYLTPTRSMIPALFCKTASCFNPFLYTISHTKFRHEVQRLFCKRKPIYQYSMTKSSYLKHSTKCVRNLVDNSAYNLKSDKHRKNLKSKLTIDNATISGIVKSNTHGVGDSSDSVFHQRPHHKISSYSRQQISPVISSEDDGIFVLNLNDAECLNIKAPETNF